MNAPQRILVERRKYNQWVADQTLEDYALRFTATRARRGTFRIGNTALGAISFLACEAIGGSITLNFGFSNAVAAIIAVGILMFCAGLPIAYYAAKYGVDIDLLTRGAGFGYLGSTVTSLVYASFTFLLFSIEASIMSAALRLCLGIPLWIGHMISALIVIPIAAYGIRVISRLQIATQPIWLVLQFAPLVYIALHGRAEVNDWSRYPGLQGNADGSINILLFGVVSSMLLSLLPQIGEQVDYLRFLPEKTRANRWRWWSALIVTGPGWVFIGSAKLLAGSFLAYLALSHGVPRDRATQPTEIYNLAFLQILHSPSLALVLTGIFVVTCQIKINVTNAYAGSIAWSNFFSRLTHNHPGRVVWMVFNVLLALLLMQIGIFRAIESILGIYANLAVGWFGALTADLMINKPLGLSPPHIEFKRAHLYDINPVGLGAMLISVLVSMTLFLGVLGPMAQAMSAFVGLFVAFVSAPAIAWATQGRYYLARQPSTLPLDRAEIRCVICENSFETSDMASCPAYGGAICSLCCTLETRCHDMCKTDSRVSQQIFRLVTRTLGKHPAAFLRSRSGQFLAVLFLFTSAIATLLTLIYYQYVSFAVAGREVIKTTLWIVFLCQSILSGVAAWLLVLAHESRGVAEAESARQNRILIDEIQAHERTDAALERATEVAEAANLAKSRYIVGMSHEIRTPLNSIFGYAQLLERDPTMPAQDAIRVIRRSAEHLSNLVDGLLDISRIESGTLRLNRDKVRLIEFLEQIVDMFRLQAAAKGIAFNFQMPEHLPRYVNTDEKRLRQILINLLSNAIKYTEIGEAALRVRYRNQVVEFEVTDTGFGILASDLQKVFEPFERGHTPSARAQPGTGLGLTITKLLTEIMGGEISIASTPREGTTVLVRLLLSEAMHSLDDSPIRRQITDYAGPRIKILLADDDAAHLDFVQRVLRPLNFVLFTAHDGDAAVALAAEIRPDVAMLDISMPGRNGWQVAAALRALDLPRLVIMMVSASVHDHQQPERGETPHDAFLVKPLDLHLMLDTLQSLTGLDWIESPNAPGLVAASEAPMPDLPPQAAPHITELIQLGRIGYVRGIEAKLKEIEATFPDQLRLTEKLRSAVRSFDLRRYLSILETLTPDE